MGKKRIEIPRDKLAEFCKRNHIRKLSLFGSVLRRDFGSKSDIDMLAEFEPGNEPGFIRLSAMERELSSMLGGRKIDLVTKQFLNHRIRGRVLSEAEVQYVQR